MVMTYLIFVFNNVPIIQVLLLKIQHKNVSSFALWVLLLMKQPENALISVQMAHLNIMEVI